MTKATILILGLLFSFSAHTQNRASNYDFMKKAEVREAKRWSLSEWMAQKEKVQMMDLWLAFNSPSPYEFMIGAVHKPWDDSVDVSSVLTESSGSNFNYELHAYAQIFGLSAEYENSDILKMTDMTGLFNVRILGDSIQNSHMTLHYGLRTREQDILGTNTRRAEPFAQVSLQMYLTPYFGLDSKYRKSTSQVSVPEAQAAEFSMTEAGIFIDFKAIRIFGAWYEEQNQYLQNSGADPVQETKTGIKSGLKFYF